MPAIISALCALSSQAWAQPPQPPPQSSAMQAADALSKEKKWAEAAKSYEAVTKAEPANAQAWYGLAMALYSLDKFADAAAAFEKANEAGKGTRVGRLALYNTAASHARAGDREKALAGLERMIKLNPLFGIGVATDADFASLRSEPRYREVALTVEKAQKPCMFDEGYRQFDFWVGEWDVLVNNQKVGTNNIKMLQQGCIIEENWSSPLQTGQSFNFYNPVTKKWHQSYMDSTGGNWMMDGEYKDGAMRYEGYLYTPQGRTPVRVTFFNLGADKVRHTAETSADDGKTWTQGWDGLYVRKK
ncbi:MAG TPA: tetratricopeptide repeat protein [Pyrinomonadaceae bacterium]|nr:tetratricopeptide repeat protein [Pyrinomonadaceae bacterium]